MKKIYIIPLLICFIIEAHGETRIKSSTRALRDVPAHLLTTIDAPVSGGNKEICGGQAFPTLSVTVNEGETADWYNSDNELVASGTTTYYRTYPMAGYDALYRYYVEARNISSGAVSATRTEVTLTVKLPAVLFAQAPQCNPENDTYYVGYTVGTGQNPIGVTSTAGTFGQVGAGYGFYNIPSGTNVTLSYNVNGCITTRNVTAPDCSAPVITALPGTSVCEGQTVTLQASGCASPGILNWSTGATTSTISFTALLGSNAEFYATCTRNQIVSPRANIVINITPIPYISSAYGYPQDNVPPNTEIILSANCSDGRALIVWNDGATTQSGEIRRVTLQYTTTYDVTCNSNNCNSEPQSFTVTVDNPCPASLTLASNSSPSGDISSGTAIRQANATSGSITATNKITGTAKVTYQAGKSITLSQGFRADNGTVFKAEMGGCQ
jgi:hypothetical protein